MNKKGPLKRSIPAMALLLCFFTGVIWGLNQQNITAGILIGLGAGLIAMAVLRFILARKKTNPPDSTNENS